MRRWLFLLYTLTACRAPVTDERPAATEEPEMETLPIEYNHLSKAELRFTQFADSLADVIDSHSRQVKSLDSTIIFNNRPAMTYYAVFTRDGGDELTKIVASGKNVQQDITYTYYYSKGRPIKSVHELRDHKAFRSMCYFLNGHVIVSTGISPATGEAARTQAFVLRKFFETGK